jgi:hypothetical protein
MSGSWCPWSILIYFLIVFPTVQVPSFGSGVWLLSIPNWLLLYILDPWFLAHWYGCQFGTTPFTVSYSATIHSLPGYIGVSFVFRGIENWSSSFWNLHGFVNCGGGGGGGDRDRLMPARSNRFCLCTLAFWRLSASPSWVCLVPLPANNIQHRPHREHCFQQCYFAFVTVVAITYPLHCLQRNCIVTFVA